MEYIYFKHKDGSVLGKLVRENSKLGIPKEQFEMYLDKGYLPCDINGNLLQPKAKTKKK